MMSDEQAMIQVLNSRLSAALNEVIQAQAELLMASRRIAALEQEAKDCKLEAKRPNLPD